MTLCLGTTCIGCFRSERQRIKHFKKNPQLLKLQSNFWSSVTCICIQPKCKHEQPYSYRSIGACFCLCAPADTISTVNTSERLIALYRAADKTSNKTTPRFVFPPGIRGGWLPPSADFGPFMRGIIINQWMCDFRRLTAENTLIATGFMGLVLRAGAAARSPLGAARKSFWYSRMKFGHGNGPTRRVAARKIDENDGPRNRRKIAAWRWERFPKTVGQGPTIILQ